MSEISQIKIFTTHICCVHRVLPESANIFISINALIKQLDGQHVLSSNAIH